MGDELPQGSPRGSVLSSIAPLDGQRIPSNLGLFSRLPVEFFQNSLQYPGMAWNPDQPIPQEGVQALGQRSRYAKGDGHRRADLC